MPPVREGQGQGADLAGGEIFAEELYIDALRALLVHPGPVMLSGYDNDLYNDMLRGWQKLQKQTRAEKGLTRTETLWVNFQAQMRLEV